MAFNMFPFTNLHNLNTDWILKTIKELKAAAETAASQVQEALQNAVLYTSQSKDTSSRRVACTNIHAVNYDSTPLGSSDAAQARYNIGAAAAADVVKITEQELTDEQKTQARNNIGAADQTTVGSLVRQMTQQVVKVTEQSWTDDQKAQARTNIGAASAAALGELDSAVGLKVDDTNGSAANLTVEGLNITDGEIVTIPISAMGTTNAPVIDVSDGQHYTRIKGVGDPIYDTEAANKAYVDSKVPLVVTFSGTTDGQDAACDKTWAEVSAAGRNIEVWYDELLFDHITHAFWKLNPKISPNGVTGYFLDISDMSDPENGYTLIRCYIYNDNSIYIVYDEM